METKAFFLETFPNYTEYSKYIELYFSGQPIQLQYDPEIQTEEFDSFEMGYVADHFTYSSRKNRIVRKFYEDLYILSGSPVVNDSNRMDGYGLIHYSNIKINNELLCTFTNAINLLPILPSLS